LAISKSTYAWISCRICRRDIKPDGEEIDKADWFNYKELPQVPTGNISISGQLIESFIDKLNG
jgi:NADH pyrophosphatase NudC (nudix superfamily)